MPLKPIGHHALNHTFCTSLPNLFPIYTPIFSLLTFTFRATTDYQGELEMGVGQLCLVW